MRNYQCRGKSYQPSRRRVYIVGGENKHGNERIDFSF